MCVQSSQAPLMSSSRPEANLKNVKEKKLPNSSWKQKPRETGYPSFNNSEMLFIPSEHKTL